MAKLRLGNIPDERRVRIVVTISGELQQRLQAYAEAWSVQTGQTIDLPKLIPPILDQFLRSDRAFSKKNPATAKSTSREDVAGAAPPVPPADPSG